MSYAETLRSLLPSLPAHRQEFGRDLLRAYDAGRASARQIEWIEKLATEAQVRGTAAQASPETAAMLKPLFELFDKARANGLTKPKPIQIAVDADDVALSRASDTSRNAGSLYVKKNGEYLGKISPDGALSLAFNVRHAEAFTIKQALTKFAADPAGVAAEFGKERGYCSFCSITLTDPRSLYVGYGPICAANYGLPWGENDPNAPAVEKKARKAKKDSKATELRKAMLAGVEAGHGADKASSEAPREDAAAPVNLRTNWTKPVQLCLMF